MNLPKGITFDNKRNKYRVRIIFNKTKLLDKSFDTLEEAEEALLKAECLKKNFVAEPQPKKVHLTNLGFLGLIQYTQQAA